MKTTTILMLLPLSLGSKRSWLTSEQLCDLFAKKLFTPTAFRTVRQIRSSAACRQPAIAAFVCLQSQPAQTKMTSHCEGL
ncbi:hypothetical protein E2C01_037856 [Portunus trituberculatus]|uniref:Secreted protein n=1 Tax=Portunus trituberculatus TaxID=210409 RepID=A0A5B7FG25_PORTR|nr:hypothetical protein [Portunus trituberculatus]